MEEVVAEGHCHGLVRSGSVDERKREELQVLS